MHCGAFKNALHDYCTGDLPLDVRPQVEEHAATCSTCGELMRVAVEMACKELVEFLNDYVDRRLSADRRAMFDRHLEICAECQVYLESYRQTVELTAQTRQPEEPMPEKLVRAILDSRRQG